MSHVHNSGKPRTIKTVIEYKNPYYTIERNDLCWPNKHRGVYYVIIHKPFVVIVATRNGSIALIRQYRYTLDRTTLEFPKGGIEKNERAQNAAHRELREELRSEANKLRYLGKLASNIGKSRCNCYVYHVLDPKHLPHPPPRDKTEQGMRIRWMPITRFREMIRRGEITDQDTLAAWALYSIQRDALAL